MFSREGLTIDVVAGFVRNWLLTPKTTLPVALALAWEPFVAKLQTRLTPAQADKLRQRVRWLAAASLVLALNDFLNKQIANNWVTDSRWNWNDEIVVVTGGSSGIGASITRRLITRNPRTRIVIIDYMPLQWTPPRGARIYYYQCDLSDASAIKTVCDRIKVEVGHPSVLFNNAGLARGTSVAEGPPADVTLTINTNLTAPFLLVKEFLPEMVRRDHGHIVNTGSMSSIIPPAGIVDYSASKAGLTALHEGLQAELKGLHNAPRVRLTLGVFSFIRTPLFTGKGSGSNFMTPLLHVETVSERLVNAVYSGYGSTIYLPGMMRYITSLKGGPQWLFTLLSHSSMKKAKLDFKTQAKRHDNTDLGRNVSTEQTIS